VNHGCVWPGDERRADRAHWPAWRNRCSVRQQVHDASPCSAGRPGRLVRHPTRSSARAPASGPCEAFLSVRMPARLDLVHEIRPMPAMNMLSFRESQPRRRALCVDDPRRNVDALQCRYQVFIRALPEACSEAPRLVAARRSVPCEEFTCARDGEDGASTPIH